MAGGLLFSSIDAFKMKIGRCLGGSGRFSILETCLCAEVLSSKHNPVNGKTFVTLHPSQFLSQNPVQRCRRAHDSIRLCRVRAVVPTDVGRRALNGIEFLHDFRFIGAHRFGDRRKRRGQLRILALSC